MKNIINIFFLPPVLAQYLIACPCPPSVLSQAMRLQEALPSPKAKLNLHTHPWVALYSTYSYVVQMLTSYNANLSMILLLVSEYAPISLRRKNPMNLKGRNRHGQSTLSC
jgi:hypothetical protein